jgi:hypothetical protein
MILEVETPSSLSILLVGRPMLEGGVRSRREGVVAARGLFEDVEV